MFKKLKEYINNRKQKKNEYWANLDLEREEKIEKIKKSRSERYMKDSKSLLLQALFILIILLIVPIYMYISSHVDFKNIHEASSAYAEEINISNVAYEDVVNDSTAIVNFNQQFDYNGVSIAIGSGTTKQDNGFLVNYDNTSGSGVFVYLNVNATIINGHKYYCYSKNDVNYQMVFADSSYFRFNSTTIITSNESKTAPCYIRYSDNTNIQNQFTIFYVVDLTQMFGSGNEPNLEQAQQLFVADYYAYNTGSAVSLSGLNSYADGFNQASALTEYMPTASSFISSIQDVDLPNSNLFGIISRGSSGITITTTSTTKDLAGYYPFNLVVPIGTKVSISARAGHNNGNFSTPIKFAYLDSVGNVNVITSANITSNSGFGLSFISPINLSGLYIIVPSDESTSYSVQIWDIKISMLVTNAIAGIQTAYDSGFEKGVEFASRSYSVGGNGYNQIFESGRLQGVEDAGNYTFLSLLTTAIDVPINSVLHMLDFDLLGMNMKSFYLSMFTFAIIVFVIKLLI